MPASIWRLKSRWMATRALLILIPKRRFPNQALRARSSVSVSAFCSKGTRKYSETATHDRIRVGCTPDAFGVLSGSSSSLKNVRLGTAPCHLATPTSQFASNAATKALSNSDNASGVTTIFTRKTCLLVAISPSSFSWTASSITAGALALASSREASRRRRQLPRGSERLLSDASDGKALRASEAAAEVTIPPPPPRPSRVGGCRCRCGGCSCSSEEEVEEERMEVSSAWHWRRHW
mmetsp:Transcript_35208/g.74970  ORF Transcript_35208/g.74970 Transcript_35208/m.74970 type:complete len:236 (-) Transcript_35208:526-1233(-)